MPKLTSKPVKVIAVTGAKGGVGKSNIALNLALSLQKLSKRVLLLDADLALANLNILLGLYPKYTLKDFLSGSRSLSEVMIDGPLGLKLIPAASGIAGLADLEPALQASLINEFTYLENNFDYLIIDTAAGLSPSNLRFVAAAQQIMVVLTPEPTSLADSYALLKLLRQEHKRSDFHIVTNMLSTSQEGNAVFAKLIKVSEQFIDVNLQLLAALPRDNYLGRAVQEKRALSLAYPNSRLAQALLNLARRLEQTPSHNCASGNIEFFLERMLMTT